MAYYFFIFISSFVILGFAACWIVDSLTFFAQLLKWREFVLVYFVLVLMATVPNLIIGFFSSVNNVPELFFGDVLGNSLITLTFITGLAAIISKGLHAESRVVQQSSFFLVFSAVLPLLLIMDGELSRGDGFVLLILFFLYSGWLFSKRRLFDQVYQEKEKIKHPFLTLFRNAGCILIGIPLLILAGYWIVQSSVFFADYFNFSIAVFGILVVALGTSLPELFFIVTAAKKNNDWLALGGIVGDGIVLPTFGLGLISVFSPIRIPLFSELAPLLVFLVAAIFLFLLFIKTRKRISPREGMVLLVVYGMFLCFEIVSRII
jgi:cation:H+ antiporter